MQLLIPYPSELLVEDLILLHAGDDMLQGLGLHLCVLVLYPYFRGFLLLHLDNPLDLLPFLSVDLVLLPDELDLPLFELHTGHFSPSDFGHLIVVLPDGVQILRDNGGLIEPAGRAHLGEVCLIIQIFLGVIESISFVDRWKVALQGGLHGALGSVDPTESLESRLRGLELPLEEGIAHFAKHALEKIENKNRI